MDSETSRTAWILGLLGLLPFAGSALAALALTGWQDAAQLWLRAYGAVILSFLGAVHWGLALAGPSPANRQRLVLGVVPSLIGWIALLLPPKPGLWVLAAGVLAMVAAEQWAALRGFVPGGYIILRWALSLGAAACLLAGALA